MADQPDIHELAKKKANVVSNLTSSPSEKAFVEERFEEFGIMLCGSARVGKSTLINALCKRRLAGTSARLGSCTQEVTKYPLLVKYDDGETKAEAIVNFWDTPGIENWDQAAVKNYVLELVNHTNPVCVIFAASPGSLANVQVIQWLCEACQGCKIFFALVCTNMYAGTKNQREAVLNDFRSVLQNVAGNVQNTDYPNICLSSRIGLVAAVNSEDFDNGEDPVKPATGVNELCMSIMKELDEEKLKGWCLALLENRDFWTRMQHSVSDFFQQTIPSYLKSAVGLFTDIVKQFSS